MKNRIVVSSLDELNDRVTFKMGDYPIFVGIREAMARDLLVSFGLVTGKMVKSKSEEHFGLELMTPSETVDRCFELADLYFKRAIKDGGISVEVDVEGK